MNESELRIMLARIEHLSAESAKWKDVADRNMRNGAQMMQARAELTGKVRELQAAEDKIGEWFEYGKTLRAAISSKKRAELPDQPTPLDTDIRF